MRLVDVATRQVVMATYAQLESSWSDSNTTAHTAQLLAKKIGRQAGSTDGAGGQVSLAGVPARRGSLRGKTALSCTWRGRPGVTCPACRFNLSSYGSNAMNLELSEAEVRILHKTLEGCLSELREEIVKSEKHEWRVALRHEKDALKAVLGRMG